MRVAAIVFENPPESIAGFAEACLRFSPQISTARAGVLFIEIGSCRLLYREDTFRLRMKILLDRFGLRARIEIENSLLEALIVALYRTLDPRLLATDSFLDYLDPWGRDEKMRAAAFNIVDKLSQVGITTVAGFTKLPLAELSWRFGAVAIHLKSRIDNEVAIGWPLWTPPEIIGEKCEMNEGEEFCGLDSLVYFAKPMLVRLFARVRGRELKVCSLNLRLKLEKYSTVREPSREWRCEFALPQSSARDVAVILRERLSRELARKPLESPVIEIDLQILQTIQDYKKQRAFFDGDEASQEALARLVSQLAEGLGRDKIFRAAIHEEAIPERSWTRTLAEPAAPPDLSDYVPMRPTKLLEKPELVHIASNVVVIRKRAYQVLEWSSVERVQTRWFDKEVDRSYYRLELAGKPAIWIFKAPDGEYYLHGYFG